MALLCSGTVQYCKPYSTVSTYQNCILLVRVSFAVGVQSLRRGAACGHTAGMEGEYEGTEATSAAAVALVELPQRLRDATSAAGVPAGTGVSPAGTGDAALAAAVPVGVQSLWVHSAGEEAQSHRERGEGQPARTRS